MAYRSTPSPPSRGAHRREPAGAARRALTILAWLAALAAPATPTAAQEGRAARGAVEGGLPRHEPLNPMMVARTGLYVPPFVERSARWRAEASVEYGSAVERNLNWPDHYLFDAELLRVQLRASRTVGAAAFVELEGGVHGAGAGFADAFFEQWHELIQWVMEERDARPRNRYGDRLLLTRAGAGARVDHTGRPRGTMLADLRATIGTTHGAGAQSVLSVTLPTAPADGHFARGVPSVNLVHARRLPVGERLVLSGAAGVGFTPLTGELARLQQPVLHMASGGAWLRLRGPHAVHAAMYYHGPAYRDTGFPELDEAEISANFGYEWRAPSGRRWRLVLAEDTRRRDPGIDLTVKLSVE